MTNVFSIEGKELPTTFGEWSATDFAIDGPFYASLIGASVSLTKDIVGDA